MKKHITWLLIFILLISNAFALELNGEVDGGDIMIMSSEPLNLTSYNNTFLHDNIFNGDVTVNRLCFDGNGCFTNITNLSAELSINYVDLDFSGTTGLDDFVDNDTTYTVSDVFIHESANNLFFNVTDNLSMNGNSLHDILELTSKDGFRLTTGNLMELDSNFTGIGNAITFYHPVDIPEGDVLYTIIQDGKLIRTFQSGLPFSASFMGNSQVISRYDTTEKNATLISSCQYTADKYNETLRVACNSGLEGADLLVENDIQAFGSIFLDEGLESRGTSTFIGNGGTDVNIVESDLYVYNSRTELVDLNGTQEILSDQFLDGTLSEFYKINQIGTDVNNWGVYDNFETSTYCEQSPCGRAKGGNSEADRIMQVDINSSIYENLFFHAHLGLVDPDTSSDILIEVSNDSSTFIEIYSRNNFTTDDVLPYEVNVSLGVGYDAVENLSLRFTFNSSSTVSRIYASDITVYGDLVSPSIVNVTRYDTKIVGGDGSGDVFIYYNDSSNSWTFSPSNVTFTSVTETDVNVTSTIILNGTAIDDWSDVNVSIDFGVSNNISLNVNDTAWSTNATREYVESLVSLAQVYDVEHLLINSTGRFVNFTLETLIDSGYTHNDSQLLVTQDGIYSVYYSLSGQSVYFPPVVEQDAIINESILWGIVLNNSHSYNIHKSGTLLNGDGIVGTAMNLDGTNDYVFSEGTDVDSGFSYSFWLYSHDYTNGVARNILERNAGGGEYIICGWYTISGNNMECRIGASGGASDVLFGSAPTENVWQHYVLTFDGSIGKMYRNGALLDTSVATVSGLAVNTADIYLGRRSSGGSYFDGKIDQFKEYNKSLILSEVQTLYSSGAPTGEEEPDSSTLTKNIDFEPFYDMTNNSNELTPYNGVLYNATENALHLDGGDDYLTFPISETYTSGNLTISAWHKTTDSSSQSRIYLGGDGTGNVLCGVGDTGNEQKARLFWNGDGTDLNTFSSASITDGDWHMVTCVYDGANSKIYIDGSVDGSGTATGSVIATSHYIGATSSGSSLVKDTSISDAVIWTKALNSTEISALYLEGRGYDPFNIVSNDTAEYNATPISSNLECSLYKNGVEYAPSKSFSCSGNTLISLVENDYIELFVKESSPLESGLDIYHNTSWLNIEKLR